MTLGAAPSARGPGRGTVALVLVGCFVCQMGLGAGYVFGAVLKNIVAEFEWSRAAFSASGIPLLAAMALSAPLVGALTERVGARRVLTFAALLLGASLWLFSRMTSLWEFYATSVLFGAALTGLGDVAVGAIAARWVTAQRGLALAFVYVGSNAGGSVVPVAAQSIAAAASWRAALEWIGLASVLVILPFALFAVREAPGQAGSDVVGGRGGEGGMDLAQAIRTRTFWILGFVLFTFYFYYLAVNLHLVAFLSDRGFSDARAAASLGFTVGLGIGSKLLMGAVADRIPPGRATFVNFAILTAGSLALLGAGRPGFLPFFLVAHGFATAAENVLLPVMVAHCFGARHLARIYGALMLTLAAGIAGQIFAGATFDRLGDYRTAFTTFAALNAVGLLALLGVRREWENDGPA